MDQEDNYENIVCSICGQKVCPICGCCYNSECEKCSCPFGSSGRY